MAARESVILVVDDNAENRALAQASLEDEGFTVRLAASGREALESFQGAPIDCVLLDIRMPGMDGIEVCRAMRALPGGEDVPILFLTAQRDLDTFDRAREANADDYVTKPFRPDELIARVAAAMKLRRMALERRELYDTVRAQRDDLMRLQLHKEQLAAFLVHDLKNPVNAIELQSRRISRDPDGTERARDAAARIQSEARALLRMITNLLDLSKADEGSLVPARHPIALAELFALVVDELSPRAREVQVSLSAAAGGVEATGDPELLRRALENLVDNAIRYAPEASVVSLTAAARDGGVELRVADAGPGVPEAQRARIFERFVQAGDAPARDSRGLGLAFCKVVAEAHGGQISIEDASPGTVFCIRLPRP